MKTVNWHNETIRNRVDHEEPFMVIRVPGTTERREIRLWWTPGGMYGQQVMALIYNEGTVLWTRTSGCGYDKTHATLEECFEELGRMPRGFDKTQSMHDYHVGGNFYRVAKRDWMKQ